MHALLVERHRSRDRDLPAHGELAIGMASGAGAGQARAVGGRGRIGVHPNVVGLAVAIRAGRDLLITLGALQAVDASRVLPHHLGVASGARGAVPSRRPLHLVRPAVAGDTGPLPRRDVTMRSRPERLSSRRVARAAARRREPGRVRNGGGRGMAGGAGDPAVHRCLHLGGVHEYGAAAVARDAARAVAGEARVVSGSGGTCGPDQDPRQQQH